MRQIVKIESYADISEEHQGANVQVLTDLNTGIAKYVTVIPVQTREGKGNAQIELEDASSVEDAFVKREEFIRNMQEKAKFPRLAVAEDMSEAEELAKRQNKLIIPR